LNREFTTPQGGVIVDIKNQNFDCCSSRVGIDPSIYGYYCECIECSLLSIECRQAAHVSTDRVDPKPPLFVTVGDGVHANLSPLSRVRVCGLYLKQEWIGDCVFENGDYVIGLAELWRFIVYIIDIEVHINE
jgi:hypothetical protein